MPPHQCAAADPDERGSLEQPGHSVAGTQPAGGRDVLSHRAGDRSRDWRMRTTTSAACCSVRAVRTMRLPAIEAAIVADPGFGPARLAACMAQLPILYRSEAEVAVRRKRYVTALEGLVASDPRVLAGCHRRGRSHSSCRTRGRTTGRCKRCTANLPAVSWRRPSRRRDWRRVRRQGERIRLGIVSGFFCDHTLLKLFLEGWLTQLDRSRFEVIGFHTGRVADAQTARCADLCDRFVHALPSAAAWRDAIVGCRAACAAVSGGRHGPDRRTAGGDAPGAGAVRDLGPARDLGDADDRLFPVQRADGAAGRGLPLHRTPGAAATSRPVLCAGGVAVAFR